VDYWKNQFESVWTGYPLVPNSRQPATRHAKNGSDHNWWSGCHWLQSGPVLVFSSWSDSTWRHYIRWVYRHIHLNHLNSVRYGTGYSKFYACQRCLYSAPFFSFFLFSFLFLFPLLPHHLHPNPHDDFCYSLVGIQNCLHYTLTLRCHLLSISRHLIISHHRHTLTPSNELVRLVRLPPFLPGLLGLPFTFPHNVFLFSQPPHVSHILL